MHRFKYSFSCEDIKAKNPNISCLNAQIWACGKASPVAAKAMKHLLLLRFVEISDIVDLKSVAELSVIDVAGYYRWGEDIRVIPEFAFLADVPSDAKIKISCEHTEYLWCNSEQAMQLLEWDSNQQAITKAEQISS